MVDLKKIYDEARDTIRNRQIGTVSRTTGVLPMIMRTANGGVSGFNAAALQSHGIDPVDFRTTQAINYAKLTLEYRDHLGMPFIETVISRLEICLDETDEMSFGRLLPEDIKKLVKEKLELNRPSRPQLIDPRPSN